MASQQLRIVLTAFEKFVDGLLKKLVLDIVANLVRSPDEGGTPVKTGWARANWIPQIGSARKTTTGTSTSVSRGEQQQGIATVAATYKHTQGPVYITNNVPYILKLNDGTSKQAAKGFIQAGVMEAIKMLG